MTRFRIVLTLGTSIVLGTLTTAGVAWWLANRPYPSSSQSGMAATGRPTWHLVAWTDPGRVSVNHAPVYADVRRHEPLMERSWPSWWAFSKPPSANIVGPEDREYVWFNETACGWPMLALKSSARYDGRKRTPAAGYRQGRSGCWEFSRSGSDYVLAYQPIWFGLLINAGIFALLWLVLLVGAPMGFHHVRRARRRRAGRCVQCDYVLRGLGDDVTKCPECGAERPASPPVSRASDR